MISALPIHLYALLAAAVAVMAIGGNLYEPLHGWWRWSPYVPVFLAMLHIAISVVCQFLACPSFDLMLHGLILIVLMFVSGRVYSDRLRYNEFERNSTIKPDSGQYLSGL